MEKNQKGEYGTLAETDGQTTPNAWRIALKYRLPPETPLQEVWDAAHDDPLVEAINAANLRHKYGRQSKA